MVLKSGSALAFLLGLSRLAVIQSFSLNINPTPSAKREGRAREICNVSYNQLHDGLFGIPWHQRHTIARKYSVGTCRGMHYNDA